VASTLPVQWLMPVVGWRPLFWGLAALLALAWVVIAWKVPAWPAARPADGDGDTSYREVWRHPYFRRMVPVGLITYGGMVAMLWAGPWMVRVAGYTPIEAATGLFTINLCSLVTFWGWGLFNPRLAARGWSANRLIAWGLPLSFLVLAGIVLSPSGGGAWAWALFCVIMTCGSQAQPAIAMAFPSALAGRALSAYNLVIFSGIFVVQWGVGLLIDGFSAMGLDPASAFRASLGVFMATSVASWAYFMLARQDNPAQ